jgi:hypothetical protein
MPPCGTRSTGANSQFSYGCKEGVEPFGDFRKALDAQEKRMTANWPPACRYRRNSRYFANLYPFYCIFPCSRIRIFLYENLIARPQAVLRDMCDFLQVDPALAPLTLSQVNVTTALGRSWSVSVLRQAPRFLADLLPESLRRTERARLLAWARTRTPPLDPTLRRELNECYRGEIIQMQALIGRDLTHWLQEPAPRICP